MLKILLNNKKYDANLKKSQKSGLSNLNSSILEKIYPNMLQIFKHNVYFQILW